MHNDIPDDAVYDPHWFDTGEHDAPWYDDPENHGPTGWQDRTLNIPDRQTRKRWNGQPVSRMESSHIMNAILWCERKFAQALDNFKKAHGHKSAFPEEVIPDFYFKSVEDMYPDYKNLREEWDRRKKE